MVESVDDDDDDDVKLEYVNTTMRKEFQYFKSISLELRVFAYWNKGSFNYSIIHI